MKNLSYSLLGGIIGNQIARYITKPITPNNNSNPIKTSALSDGWNNIVKNSLIILASTTIPILLNVSSPLFSGTTSGLIAGGLTALLNLNSKNNQLQKPQAKPTKIQTTATQTTATQQIVDDFKIAFRNTDKKDYKLTELLKILEKKLNNLTPNDTIKTIQNIFAYFKYNNDETYKSSEIWTGLLEILSKQENINDKQKILLNVADGNNNTEIEFEFKQLKDFLNSFDMSPTNQSDDIYQNFVTKLKINKPLFKIFNNGNHYTGLVIEKISDNQYSISNINSLASDKYTQEILDETDFNDKLKTLIDDNNKNTFLETFFSDTKEIELKNQTALDTLQAKNDFEPYSQDVNACHQIVVMNLLKYFIEHNI